MTQIVLTIDREQAANAECPSRGLTGACPIAINREILCLGVVLAVLQIMDGVLTAIGVYHFGIGAEANLFIRWCMEQFGPNTALVALKSVALLVIVALCVMARSVGWLRPAMKTVILVYLVAAIIPWSAILAKRLL